MSEKSLIIVESPSKAKTINKYLGDKFVVTSSYGHIRDLPDKGIAIDIENNYEPQYEVNEDKKKLVAELKKLAKDSSEIYLATDEDREGEAISWHLCHVLNLDPKKAKRITYTEVTKKAIQNAIGNPRTLNLDLVNAQQARRVLDRLVGYELSPVLWKKVKPSLSAGRVQSVAVRLIVEREREIKEFVAVSSFKISAYFFVNDANGKKTVLKAEGNTKFKQEKDAEQFLSELKNAIFSVQNIETKPAKRSPSAPFTTSTLQQEASRKLGFSVSRTMRLAQSLYEDGHITYMRTDSTSLSDLALAEIATEVKNRYGEKFHKRKQYVTKNESAQEAHEAIRPSNVNNTEVETGRDEQRLYELIWKRTVASQMSDAELERTIISIQNNKNKELLSATGEVVLFEGFLKVYTEGNDDEPDADSEDSTLLPPVKVGQELALREMNATERFTKPQPRYTEASLVKKLEELGIGRPSTYAPTISTIQHREYVVKENREGTQRSYRVLTLKDSKISSETKSEITGAEKMKLFPTDIGSLVTDFLVDHFGTVLDYGFTAKVEKQFDEIAVGKLEWTKMIDGFYQPFHTNVSQTEKEAKRVTGERLLGEDPESGEPVYARMGRYGAMVQIGKADDESKKPRFASLRPGQSIESITFEEAMTLFKLPRTLGEFEGKEVKVNVGRFGPYVMHNSKFVSLKKENDPYTISLEESIELIQAKREAEANALMHDFAEEGIQVLKGRFGPYIKKGKDNYKIPKGTDATTLTLEEVLEIIKAAPAPKKSAAKTAKKAPKKK
ncbi:MAG: type I DNA topoisomerase [Chitinophagales bacterium]|nr:type I DNA topoisomerase [Chitinophagales bacterium]MBX2984998.1 type I DNA topoisomerase [Bacteroidia bacterium]OJV28879.1 MAG: DNA topoisomerase I [Bacteroidetes bacterium 37-13]